MSFTSPTKSPLLSILQKVKVSKSNKTNLHDLCPICIIVVGMAGSGKTTLVSMLQRGLALPEAPMDKSISPNKKKGSEKFELDNCVLNSEHINSNQNEEERKVGYCLNLDPATKLVPFGASLDIRDTVDYLELMKQHNLGPNGAILTALNLYSTKFDQVLNILERRSYGDKFTLDKISDDTRSKKLIDYILVDTPGQIEAFTWSASGQILSSSLASSFPTIMAYVIDTPRCTSSPDTFMNNMLYACSVYYRHRLPLVIVMNKCDVTCCEICKDWMVNYESFQEALDNWTTQRGSGSGGYYTSLTRSLSLVLDEFYEILQCVGVSSVTGEGFDDFWNVVDKASEDFDRDYVERILEYNLQEHKNINNT